MKFAKKDKNVEINGGVVSAKNLDEFYQDNKTVIEQILKKERNPKTAIYPGSFNPWHEGHRDIYNKASECFDHIIIAMGSNPEKKQNSLEPNIELIKNDSVIKMDISTGKASVKIFDGLLVDFAKDTNASAIIRGLRNGHDLQYEMNQQYWNEDLGLRIPIVYFICDRKLSHISSSIIRSLEKFKENINGKKETEEET